VAGKDERLIGYAVGLARKRFVPSASRPRSSTSGNIFGKLGIGSRNNLITRIAIPPSPPAGNLGP
jgi:hypothetical protein